MCQVAVLYKAILEIDGICHDQYGHLSLDERHPDFINQTYHRQTAQRGYTKNYCPAKDRYRPGPPETGEPATRNTASTHEVDLRIGSGFFLKNQVHNRAAIQFPSNVPDVRLNAAQDQKVWEG